MVYIVQPNVSNMFNYPAIRGNIESHMFDLKKNYVLLSLKLWSWTHIPKSCLLFETSSSRVTAQMSHMWQFLRECIHFSNQCNFWAEDIFVETRGDCWDINDSKTLVQHFSNNTCTSCLQGHVFSYNFWREARFFVQFYSKKRAQILEQFLRIGTHFFCTIPEMD